MNFLFDLQHPAHLHFFYHLILKLKAEGHNVKITGRNKDILIDLAREYNLEIDIFGNAQKGILNLGKELFYRQWHLYRIIKKFKPDIIMAIAGTYVSSLGKLMNIPTYIFYDTEHATISNLLSYPFAKCIYIPTCYRKKIFWNHKRYNSYHEIAYLHPNYFKPDSNIINVLGLNKKEKFSIVRFVKWEAGHDIGLSGLTYENKIKTIKELEKYGKVFISSEGELPNELKKYKLHINITKIHHVLAKASLLFGESATMASEAALLGTPSIYIDPIGRGYTDELEKKYHIVHNFKTNDQEKAIKKISKIFNYPSEYWENISQKIIKEKIDTTKMLYKIATQKNDQKK